MTITLHQLIRVRISQDQEAVTQFRDWLIKKSIFWANVTMVTASSLDAHFNQTDAFEIQYFFDALAMRREKNRSLCTGTKTCDAPTHMHGCYADAGNCFSPQEHTHSCRST